MFISLRFSSRHRIDKPSSISSDMVSSSQFRGKMTTYFDRDTRSFSQPLVQYIESHSDDVTEVSRTPYNWEIERILNHPSCNSIQVDHRYYCLAPLTVWWISTTLPSQTKKKHYIRPSTMEHRYIMQISSATLISLLCHTMRSSQCTNWWRTRKKALRSRLLYTMETWERC